MEDPFQGPEKPHPSTFSPRGLAEPQLLAGNQPPKKEVSAAQPLPRTPSQPHRLAPDDGSHASQAGLTEPQWPPHSPGNSEPRDANRCWLTEQRRCALRNRCWPNPARCRGSRSEGDAQREAQETACLKVGESAGPGSHCFVTIASFSVSERFPKASTKAIS